MIFDEKRNKQIVADLAISYENEETNSQKSSETSESTSTTNDKSSNKNNESSSPNISANDLREKKGELNLEERKKLLNILKFLFGAQLFFMNVVVVVIVLWGVLDLQFLRTVEDTTLTILVDMTKYYITAVLAEQLGCIIYIVHNVFSDKTIDKLSS